MRPIHTAATRFLSTLATAVALVIALLGGSATEGAMVPQTVEQLVANSTHIVRGQVLRVQSQWDPSHAYIFTTVSLRVNERHMGDLRGVELITLYVPGGVVADTGLRVEHAPRFDIGQDVMVFLRQVDNLFAVTSWEQGKYTVVNGQVVEKQTPITEFVNEVKKAVER